jgi:hypothetical protein
MGVSWKRFVLELVAVLAVATGLALTVGESGPGSRFAAASVAGGGLYER